MRIHTDYLSENDLAIAADRARVTFERREWRGSFSHQGAWDIILSGGGAYRSQYRERDTPAATWDEWGIFLAALFRTDPGMRVGGRKNPTYANPEHFHWSTGERYETLAWADQHRLHRWDHPGWSVTGAYSVAGCRCGAVKRWTLSSAWLAENFPAPVPQPAAPTMRERLERVADQVAQIRREVDADYPYDPAKDRRALAEADGIGPWLTHNPTPGEALDVPTALPWSPDNRRAVLVRS